MKIWIGQSTRIAESWWFEAKSDSACLHWTLLSRPLYHLDSYTHLIATFQNKIISSDTVAAAKLAKPSYIRTSLFHVHHIRYTCVYDLLTEKCTHNKYASHFSISQPRFTRVFSNELRKPNMISTDSYVMLLLLFISYTYCPADQVISDWWRDIDDATRMSIITKYTPTVLNHLELVELELATRLECGWTYPKFSSTHVAVTHIMP